ncbi:MAG: response regulator, partial [Rickettsiaceae bacterium]|nr:response regulator [Rickettsiaceae bacterium]
DMMMPDIYGLDALKQIRKDPEIGDSKIYIHTSLSEGDPDLTEARKIGIEGVIEKNMPAGKMKKLLSCYLL